MKAIENLADLARFIKKVKSSEERTTEEKEFILYLKQVLGAEVIGRQIVSGGEVLIGRVKDSAEGNIRLYNVHTSINMIFNHILSESEREGLLEVSKQAIPVYLN